MARGVACATLCTHPNLVCRVTRVGTSGSTSGYVEEVTLYVGSDRSDPDIITNHSGKGEILISRPLCRR
jgi:hypothetical protein